MLSRLRGSGLTSGATEKLSPTGCPGVGYGSWPTTRTRTCSKGNVNARNTFDPAGRYRRPAATSPRRKSPIAATWSATGSHAFAQPPSTSSASGRAVTADNLRQALYEQHHRVGAGAAVFGDQSVFRRLGPGAEGALVGKRHQHHLLVVPGSLDHLRRLVRSEQGPRVAAKDLHEPRLIAVVRRTVGELQLGDRVHSHRATVAAARPGWPSRTTASPPRRPIRRRRQACAVARRPPRRSRASRRATRRRTSPPARGPLRRRAPTPRRRAPPPAPPRAPRPGRPPAPRSTARCSHSTRRRCAAGRRRARPTHRSSRPHRRGPRLPLDRTAVRARGGGDAADRIRERCCATRHSPPLTTRAPRASRPPNRVLRHCALPADGPKDRQARSPTPPTADC